MHINSTPEPMKLLRTFHLPLHGHTATVEALISHTSYDILEATGRAGRKLDVTCDDLDIIEAHIDSQIITSETEAYCFESGRMERFKVISHQGSVLAVINTGGYSLPRHTPQFTEAAEAFALDREFAAAIESDQPRAAALAGYLQPRPLPNQQGHGLRRAA